MLKAIVLLGAACVWLLAERHSLTEKMTTIEGKVETLRRQNSDLDAKIAVKEGRSVAKTSDRTIQATVPPKSWLQDQIENHASLSRLQTSNAQNNGTRSYVRPPYYYGTYGAYPSTTVNYNNTYIVAPRPQSAPLPPPPPVKLQRPVSR